MKIHTSNIHYTTIQAEIKEKKPTPRALQS